MTAQNLRSSILQLAMQGKLVPQMSTDEPVSELLKRITQQKTQLVEDGVIKKEKPLPTISDEDIPFDIPTSWLWVRLGDYCLDAFSGKSPVYSKTPTPYEVIGQAANQQAGLDYTQVKYTVSEFWDSMGSKYFLRENDVLLNTLGHGTLGRSGIVPGLQKKLLTDGHLFVFRLCSATASKYFYYYLQYKRPEIEKSANGSTNQTFLSLKRTNQWLIPTPPLAEQERIVEKIEELLPMIEQYGEAEGRLTALNTEFPDRLRKSILQQAVQGKLTQRDSADEPASELLKRIRAEKARLIAEGKIKKEKPLPEITEDEIPFEIPDTWEWVRLSQIAVLENGDRSDKYPVEKDYVDLGIPFFGAKDMLESEMSFNNVRYISEKKFLELGNGKLKDKDFICLLRGSVGKCAIFNADEKHQTGFICAQMVIIRSIEKELCKYLQAYLASPLYTKYIESKVTGTAVRQLPAKELGNAIVPLPPISEQQRIVQKLEQLLPLCNMIK